MFLTTVRRLISLTRFDKPVGILLLLWPTLWALWIAAQGVPSLSLLLIFIFGTILMRAAGCAINDFADRHIDEHVKRTQHRPLASGQLHASIAILIFFVFAVCAFILVLQTNRLTILLAVPAFLSAASYPFFKRFTHWPQVFLGVAFAFGIPMAFAATLKYIPAIAWLFMFISILWTLVYDTEYAMVDCEDDLKIGVKSTAILFGRYDIFIITILQMIIIALLIVCGLWLKLNVFYFMGVILACVCSVYQQHLIKQREPQQYFKAFLNNQWFGMAIFLGLVLAYW